MMFRRFEQDRRLEQAAWREAVELRARYGREAERWCRLALEALQDDPERQKLVRLVKRRLG